MGSLIWKASSKQPFYCREPLQPISTFQIGTTTAGDLASKVPTIVTTSLREPKQPRADLVHDSPAQRGCCKGSSAAKELGTFDAAAKLSGPHHTGALRLCPLGQVPIRRHDNHILRARFDQPEDLFICGVGAAGGKDDLYLGGLERKGPPIKDGDHVVSRGTSEIIERSDDPCHRALSISPPSIWARPHHIHHIDEPRAAGHLYVSFLPGPSLSKRL